MNVLGFVARANPEYVERSSPLQREVLAGLLGRKQGGGYLEIFAAMEVGGCPR